MAAALCGLIGIAGAAMGASQALTLGPDGETAAVYSYKDAGFARITIHAGIVLLVYKVGECTAFR